MKRVIVRVTIERIVHISDQSDNKVVLRYAREAVNNILESQTLSDKITVDYIRDDTE